MQQTKTSSTPLMPPGRWRRFACMMYEGVLLFGVVFLADYLFDTLTQSNNALELRNVRQAIVVIAIGIYFISSWHIKGQTLPMKTWHIKVVNIDGSKPSLIRLVWRYILIWPVPLLGLLIVQIIANKTGYISTTILAVFAPFLLFIWTWFDTDKQFLHDRIAKTKLITL